LTPRRPHATPSISTVSALPARVSPERAAKNSSWPLPATPAIDTISPPRTSSDTASSATANGCGFGIDMALTRSRTGASAPTASGAVNSRNSAPTIMLASRAAVSFCGSHAPTTLPWRRMVA
jgi:hypothetical protein